MNTLYVNNLSTTLINTIINTIGKKNYKVIYKRSNRKLVSIYFYDEVVYHKALQYVESIQL
jgi:hypothetical protein